MILSKAVQHLQDNDPVLALVIQKHGAFEAKSHTDYYRELVSSIISQQLSVKAAASIERRFTESYGGIFPPPGDILRTRDEQLRAVGLSKAKIAYIKDLSGHVVDGRLQLDRLPTMSNDAIIKVLTEVKGIGQWTAHMFLIFALGRLDVLPIGDLGIRKGIYKLYGLPTVPTPDEVSVLAKENNWHPYESVASWYVWRSLENDPD